MNAKRERLTENVRYYTTKADEAAARGNTEMAEDYTELAARNRVRLATLETEATK